MLVREIRHLTPALEKERFHETKLAPVKRAIPMSLPRIKKKRRTLLHMRRPNMKTSAHLYQRLIRRQAWIKARGNRLSACAFR